jgi:hypothetical protein
VRQFITRKVFESEVGDRRGCDYLVGTNGYDMREEEFNKGLGLSPLKSSADCGHADAQFRYGLSLLEGRDCVKG